MTNRCKRATPAGVACRHPAATKTTDKSHTIAGGNRMLERISLSGAVRLHRTLVTGVRGSRAAGLALGRSAHRAVRTPPPAKHLNIGCR
jgi:hypothetical protein